MPRERLYIEIRENAVLHVILSISFPQAPHPSA